jgi:hypothetical protein
VTGHDRQPRVGQVAVGDVEIGATDAARAHLDEELAGQRDWSLALDRDEPGSRPRQHHRLHRRKKYTVMPHAMTMTRLRTYR